MNKSRRKPFSIEEGKVKASILLKYLHGQEPEKAAKRFQCLPEFANLSISDILQQNIKRAHALQVIAIENGFRSWVDLKIQSNFIIGGHLNLWFANYSEAKNYLEKKGGFLLPYKNQYFICNEQYIKQIGFDPKDPDWKRIGYNWAIPDNKKAWQQLHRKWVQAKVKGDHHE